MTEFAPTDPYHRFYLTLHSQYVDIVHTTYEVVKITAGGAWIRENISGAAKERWVSRGRKAFAYQDVALAWNSFKIRMEKRWYHAKDELEAVEAAIQFNKHVTEGPEEYARIIEISPKPLFGIGDN